MSSILSHIINIRGISVVILAMSQDLLPVSVPLWPLAHYIWNISPHIITPKAEGEVFCTNPLYVHASVIKPTMKIQPGIHTKTAF